MKRQASRAKKRIESELARVNQAIERLKKEPRAEELEGFGDNTPISEEIDAILVNEERELQSERLGRLLERAAALDEAIHRIDEGQYGICLSCGREMSAERLEAVPEALRCLPCQEEAEKTHPRELHAHEWKRAEETYRERLKNEKGLA